MKIGIDVFRSSIINNNFKGWIVVSFKLRGSRNDGQMRNFHVFETSKLQYVSSKIFKMEFKFAKSLFSLKTNIGLKLQSIS